MTRRRWIQSFFLAVALLIAPLTLRATEDELPPGANKLCPVMTDQASKPEMFVEHDGKRIYFCCNTCRQRFLKEPATFVVNLTAASQPAATSAPATQTSASPLAGLPPDA